MRRSVPFLGALCMGVSLPAAAVSPSTPAHRDNRAYVKTTCSFDSRQLIIDPIKPKSAIVGRSKRLKSACEGTERLRSFCCQSLLTFLLLLPWPGGQRLRKQRLRVNVRRSGGGDSQRT